MARLIEYVVPTSADEMAEETAAAVAAEIAAVLDEAEAILREAERAGSGGDRHRRTGVVPQDPAGTRSAATTTACLPHPRPSRPSDVSSSCSVERGRTSRSDAFPWARSPPA